MKVTEEIKQAKAAKATSGKGFAETPQAPTATKQEPVSPVAPATSEAADSALQFMGAAQNNIATQLNRRADFLQGLDEMLDKAAVKIATAEQDILSGVALERKLSAYRADYGEVLADATISVEFEALDTLDSLSNPGGFADIGSAVKRISPAAKRQLDQAVLGPAK